MHTHKSENVNEVQVSTHPDLYPNPLESYSTERSSYDLSGPICESLGSADIHCQLDNQGTSCGKPHLMPDVQMGQRILYIGAGADADCCALAEQVGPEGLVASLVLELRPQIHDYQNLVFLVASVTELPEDVSHVLAPLR